MSHIVNVKEIYFSIMKTKSNKSKYNDENIYSEHIISIQLNTDLKNLQIEQTSSFHIKNYCQKIRLENLIFDISKKKY